MKTAFKPRIASLHISLICILLLDVLMWSHCHSNLLTIAVSYSLGEKAWRHKRPTWPEPKIAVAAADWSVMGFQTGSAEYASPPHKAQVRWTVWWDLSSIYSKVSSSLTKQTLAIEQGCSISNPRYYFCCFSNPFTFICNYQYHVFVPRMVV